MIEPFGIASRDVARDAFVESESRKKAERGGEHSLAMQALFGGSGERGRSIAGVLYPASLRFGKITDKREGAFRDDD